LPQDAGAVSSAPLATPALVAKFPGTIAATISDETSVMLLAKYTYNQIKLFSGFEEITFANPHDPQLTGFTDIAGIPVAAANITNTAYTNHRIMQIAWVGARYAFSDTFDVGAGYYHYNQPSYNTFSCDSAAISSKCAGTMNAYSIDADWRFAKKFDVYAGVMYSKVNGGLANGYLYTSNLAPTAGLRFRF
jgi:predicted porin